MSYKEKNEILYLSANPVEDKQGFESEDPQELGLNYEASYINAGIEHSRYGHTIRFDAFYNLHFSEIETYITKYQPEVLHLAARCKNGKLLLTGKVTEIESVDPEKIVSVLKRCAQSVKLLVLRIFGSGKLAKQIYEETGIKAVLYLGNKKDPQANHEFISDFYELLGNNMNLRRSYNLARNTTEITTCGLLSDKETGNSTIVNPAAIEPNYFSLLLASTPVGFARLNHLAEELDMSAAQHKIGDTKALYPSSKKEILMAIACYQPRVILLSTHGGMDHIAFYDEQMNKVRVNKDWLTDVFKEFMDTVECVIFSSCENLAISYAVSKYIPYVIGTDQPVIDYLASIVTKHFFENLLQDPDNIDFAGCYKKTMEMSMSDYEIELCHILNLKVYHLFQRSDYQKTRRLRRQEILDISGKMVLEQYEDKKDDFLMQQFAIKYPDWIGQIKGSDMSEIVASFLRNSIYLSFDDIAGAYIDDYVYLQEHTESSRIAYLPLTDNADDPAVRSWMLFKYLNSISPDQTWLNMEEAGSKTDEIFHVVLITDMLGSADDFKNYYEKNRKILKKKKITLLVLCSIYEAELELAKYIEDQELDVTICGYVRCGKAFHLYPEYQKMRRNFEKNCKNYIHMDSKDVFGKNNAEALCFFYNRIPEETLGIFTHIDDDFFPLFTFDKEELQKEFPQAVPEESEDEATEDDTSLEDMSEIISKIKEYLAKHPDGFSLEDMMAIIGLTCGEIRTAMDEMVRTKSKRFLNKSEMFETIFPILRKCYYDPKKNAATRSGR